MISKRLILLFLLASACKPAPQQATAGKPSAVPQVRATVVSIRTTLQPSKKVHGHEIVIANGLARSTDERDVWRLFDTGKRTVTTVDDISRTYSTEPLDALKKRQRAVLAERAPAKLPPLDYEVTDQKRPMFGTVAQQAVASSGTYRREIWVADHPSIPPELFSMMHASSPPTSPLAPLGAEIEKALMGLKGFPMIDKYELPFGKSGRFGAERVVVGVAARDVPQSLLVIPRDYRDVTPKAAATKRR